jgi:UDP-GlcNAc:undecaprenyl-phosphate GlcNAc-1-phosphate transferase
MTTTFMLIFIGALVLALAATPLARVLAPRLGLLAVPRSRDLHTRPVPKMGGVAIVLAFLVGLVVLLLVSPEERERLFFFQQLAGIILGASLVSFLGIWDDRWGLSPLIKLAGQVIAAGVLVATGVGITMLPTVELNVAATLLWVVGITNALNLLDNMDGLSGGVAAIASAFFLLMALSSQQWLVAIMSAALLGACLGFLVYNFNPASIFMGDAGTMFIGFVLAATSIKLRFDNVTFVTWMIPVLVLGLPLFDTTLVVISRLRRGVNPLTTPGKDHVSHRLVALGMTHREAVLSLYLICGTLGLLALFVTQASVPQGYFIGAMVALAALWALWKLEFQRQLVLRSSTTSLQSSSPNPPGKADHS